MDKLCVNFMPLFTYVTKCLIFQMTDSALPVPEGQVAPGTQPGDMSHPWEVISRLKEDELKQFKDNFSSLCMPHQRLIFRKLLTSSAEMKKFLVLKVLEKPSYTKCKYHKSEKHKINEVTDVTSATTKEQAPIKRKKKNIRQKLRTKKYEIKQRVEILIQKFRMKHMTRQEVWGWGRKQE